MYDSLLDNIESQEPATFQRDKSGDSVNMLNSHAGPSTNGLINDERVPFDTNVRLELESQDQENDSPETSLGRLSSGSSARHATAQRRDSDGGHANIIRYYGGNTDHKMENMLCIISSTIFIAIVVTVIAIAFFVNPQMA